jgi:hypothetical protein
MTWWENKLAANLHLFQSKQHIEEMIIFNEIQKPHHVMHLHIILILSMHISPLFIQNCHHHLLSNILSIWKSWIFFFLYSFLFFSIMISTILHLHTQYAGKSHFHIFTAWLWRIGFEVEGYWVSVSVVARVLSTWFEIKTFRTGMLSVKLKIGTFLYGIFTATPLRRYT